MPDQPPATPPVGKFAMYRKTEAAAVRRQPVTAESLKLAAARRAAVPSGIEERALAAARMSYERKLQGEVNRAKKKKAKKRK